MIKKNSSTTKVTRSGSKKLKEENRESRSLVASKSDMMPVPKLPIVRSREALRRLGVSQESLDRTPKISNLLEASLGDIKVAIEAMRFSAEPCLQKFLETYDAVPVGDLPSLPFEAIFLKSEISVNEFLGAIIVSFQSIQAQKSAMLAMAGHPEVIQKSLEVAKTPGGVQDRRMLNEALRFLPSPKGMSFNFNLPSNTAPGDERKPKEPSGDDGEMDVNNIFPVITEHQEEWQERRQKLLRTKN